MRIIFQFNQNEGDEKENYSSDYRQHISGLT